MSERPLAEHSKTHPPQPATASSPCLPARQTDEADRALTTSGAVDVRALSIVEMDASAEESVIGFESGRKAHGAAHARH